MSEPSNDHLLTVLLGIKEDIGAVKTGITSAQSHTESVSRKADGIARSLEGHIASTDAHGAGSERRGRSQLSSAFAGILSGILGSLALLKLVGWKP